MPNLTVEDLKRIQDLAMIEMRNFPVEWHRIPEFDDASLVRAYCYQRAVALYFKKKGFLPEIPEYETKTYIKP